MHRFTGTHRRTRGNGEHDLAPAGERAHARQRAHDPPLACRRHRARARRTRLTLGLPHPQTTRRCVTQTRAAKLWTGQEDSSRVSAGNSCAYCPQGHRQPERKRGNGQIGHPDRTRRTLHSAICRGEAEVRLSWVLRGADWRRSHVHRCQSCRHRFADDEPGSIPVGEERFPRLCRCDLGRGGHTNCRASGPYCPACAAQIADEQREMDEWEREWD